MTNTLPVLRIRPLSCFLAALSLACAAASAATIDKEGTVTAGLATDGSAWVGGNVPGSADVARWNSASAIGSQTMDGAASWEGIAVTDASAGVTLAAGSGGTLSLGASGVDMSAATASLTISAPTALGSAQAWNVGAGTSLTVSGLVTGAAGITKAGNGALVLSSGSNSFAGGITLAGGTLRIGGNLSNSNTTSVLGAVASAVLNIQEGTTITTNSNRAVAAQTFNVLGNFTVGSPGNTSRLLVDTTVDLNGGTRTLTIDAGNASGGSNNIKLGFQHFNGSTTTLAVTNGTLRVVASAAVIGAGQRSLLGFLSSINFVNNAGLTIGNGTATFFSGTYFGTGTNAPAVTVEAGGLFDLSSQDGNSRSQEVYSLSGDGTVINRTTGSGTATLTVNGTTVITTFSGSIEDGTTGKMALNKRNTSTLLLTGVNTYTGATNITGGTLIVNGSLSAASPVSVSGTGELGGSGSVGAVTVSGGGKVSPGASIGTLNATSLLLNSDDTNAIALFELSNVDSASDMVVLAGALTQGTGSSFIFDFNNSGAVGQLYTLITFSSTTFLSASSFSAINSAVPGTFILGANSLQYSTSAVPEPSTWAMLAGTLALLAALRRRKR